MALCARRTILTPVLGAIILALLFCAPYTARAAEPEIFKSDDWRYRALSELATAGILDSKDAPYYLTKIPINVDFAVACVERALIKLGLKDIDLTNVTSVDISIMGAANQKVGSREAWLLNDLVKDFAQKLIARGTVGKKQTDSSSQTNNLSLLIPKAGQDATETAAQSGSSVLSLNDVLKKINMPSPVSQASLTMSPAEAIDGEMPAGIEPLEIRTINPEKSKVVSLFEVLNVSASVFADQKADINKSSAGIGLVLGNSQGGGLTLDYRMTGNRTADSGISDLIASTGVGIKYQINSIVPLRSANDSLTVQAGYNIESGDLKSAAERGIELQASASLGIYYKLLLGNSAFVHAGYKVEQVRNLIASGVMSTKSWLYDDSSPLNWIFRGTLRLDSDIGIKQLAGIDLGYRLFGNTSIMVGYRLIDFSDFDKIDLQKNLTALGISIKF